MSSGLFASPSHILLHDFASQVDAHNIVPCWVASPKQEYSARTIRGKIHAQLPEFLTEFPPVIRHPYPPSCPAEVSAGDTSHPFVASPREFYSFFLILGGDGWGWAQ